MDEARRLIRELGLAPHPEGGHYKEMFRARAEPGERAASTAIYFLLERGEISRWHRVDADEIWHFYLGDPLELALCEEGGVAERRILGTSFDEGQTPQIVVPRGVWQAARPLGAFTLVGCTVSPAFEFSGFELAAPGFSPERRDAADATQK